MKIWHRILLFVAVYICVLTFPWWLSVVVLFGLTIYVPMYVEVLFFAFLFDTLYASNYSFPYTALCVALILLLVVTLLRPFIRTEQNQKYV